MSAGLEMSAGTPRPSGLISPASDPASIVGTEGAGTDRRRGAEGQRTRAREYGCEGESAMANGRLEKRVLIRFNEKPESERLFIWSRLCCDARQRTLRWRWARQHWRVQPEHPARRPRPCGSVRASFAAAAAAGRGASPRLDFVAVAKMKMRRGRVVVVVVWRCLRGRRATAVCNKGCCRSRKGKSTVSGWGWVGAAAAAGAAGAAGATSSPRCPRGRGLHSLTSELNLRTFGNASLTLELLEHLRDTSTG